MTNIRLFSKISDVAKTNRKTQSSYTMRDWPSSWEIFRDLLAFPRNNVTRVSAYEPENDVRGIGEAAHWWFDGGILACHARWRGDRRQGRCAVGWRVISGVVKCRGRIRHTQDEVGSLTGARHRAIIAAGSRPRIKKGNNTYEMRNIRGRNWLIHLAL